MRRYAGALFRKPWVGTTSLNSRQRSFSGGAARVILGDTFHSTVAYFQTDAYFAGLSVGEMNAGLFKGFLYLEHSGEVSFHDSFVLLDPLKRR
jgi:hypothetical protein